MNDRSIDGRSVAMFMQLAGLKLPQNFSVPDENIRKLGAQLLLTELLEYIIHGLGVTPIINGTRVSKSEDVSFEIHGDVNLTECLDGLADVGYTMFWNAKVLGAPLEEAYRLVCENNLQKFVELDGAQFLAGPIARERWGCNQGVEWPSEVSCVTAVAVEQELFAVGKDERGKVRKPSSYRPVDLAKLVVES